jgi:pimeloyl-ACP methyl ester carboxylesterase
MEWLGRLLRLSASPARARAILEFSATVDVRALLSGISAPALVLHRHLPDARLVLLDGADHWPWFGDADAVIDAINEFVGELQAASR